MHKLSIQQFLFVFPKGISLAGDAPNRYREVVLTS